jgi:hypothetical protein
MCTFSGNYATSGIFFVKEHNVYCCLHLKLPILMFLSEKNKTYILGINMTIKTFGIVTATALAVSLTASISNADVLDLNKKEVNGKSIYLGIAYMETEFPLIVARENSIEQGFKGTMDDSQTGQLTFGTDFGYVRSEVEASYRQTELSSVTGGTQAHGQTHLGSIINNIAIEYSIDPLEVAGQGSSGFSVTPFVMGGIGAIGGVFNVSYLDSAGVYKNSSDDTMVVAPASQIGAGLTIGTPFGLELFAQYSELQAYTFGRKGVSDVKLDNISGGLRINF